MKAFETHIGSQINDDEAKLSYLVQFFDGNTKSQIEHCTMLESSEGFYLAKEILHKRFGQNFMIAKAFIDDILNWLSSTAHTGARATDLVIRRLAP